MNNREVPCDTCNGYGYLGHTNPKFGTRCEDCEGVGVRSDTRERQP